MERCNINGRTRRNLADLASSKVFSGLLCTETFHLLAGAQTSEIEARSTIVPLRPRPPMPHPTRKLTLLPVLWTIALAMELKLVLLPKSPCKKTMAGSVTSPSIRL